MTMYRYFFFNIWISIGIRRALAPVGARWTALVLGHHDAHVALLFHDSTGTAVSASGTGMMKDDVGGLVVGRVSRRADGFQRSTTLRRSTGGCKKVHPWEYGVIRAEEASGQEARRSVAESRGEVPRLEWENRRSRRRSGHASGVGKSASNGREAILPLEGHFCGRLRMMMMMVVIVARHVFLSGARRRVFRRFALVLVVSGRRSFRICLVGVDSAVVAFRLRIVVVIDELLDGSENVSVAPVQRWFERGSFGLREKSGQSIQRDSLARCFRLTSAAATTSRIQSRSVVVYIRQLELCPIGWQFRLVCWLDQRKTQQTVDVMNSIRPGIWAE